MARSYHRHAILAGCGKGSPAFSVGPRSVTGLVSPVAPHVWAVGETRIVQAASFRHNADMAKRIFHPTDFSSESRVAFVHALKLALLSKGQLDMMHVDADAPVSDWDDFPQVRGTLESWGVLPPGSSRADVVQLGLGVEKILAFKEDPETSLLRHLDNHPADLMVLATHQHNGVYHWLGQALAEPLARRAQVPTLFLPAGSPGFISEKDGAVDLQRILIPIAHDPAPQRAVDLTVWLGELLSLTELTIELLHVGQPESPPHVDAPDRNGWTWRSRNGEGSVVEEILRVERELLP